MATLEKIRSKSVLLLVIIGLALLTLGNPRGAVAQRIKHEA